MKVLWTVSRIAGSSEVISTRWFSARPSGMLLALATAGRSRATSR
jgi:hypothetical protein